MRSENERVVYLKDYTPSPYLIDRVELDVRLAAEVVRVRALLHITPREGTPPATPLVLDGDELKLDSIAIDGLPLPLVSYEEVATGLVIDEPPTRPFVLETEVSLRPESNTKLMGLYRSSGTWVTQCEPEGFRRITYFLDRPDVLARYKVRMTAAPKLPPVLPSNGKFVETGTSTVGHQSATWDDPFPKPSYLFAMVAGDLGVLSDSFTTASGRKVALGIYCDHGREPDCVYAMDALKRSMAWDERRFGREYDLDIFNIAVVSDFNFGAMENKGLNIFNDKLVFARPETATDADYAGIERVIAHEYFHNWTGDRITCRDWFQLCLKEGLTVYRDQEFTMDERSRPVKRIEDVTKLRTTQFPEDGGPLAHPARPDHYREIENFYTRTVYDKGAEIVRMLATLLGEEGFRRGMDLYFERHDGEATTIEAFIKAFEDATDSDLQHFAQWYLQAGTPQVNVVDHYDADSRTYTLTISQKVDPTPGQPNKQPMVLPIRFGLVGPNGSPMGHERVSGGEVRDDLIVLDSERVTLKFEGIPSRPVPSLFRQFSAPVKISSSLTQEDQLFLARHDADPFSRWQSLQDVAMALLVNAVAGTEPAPDKVAALADALADTIGSDTLDPAFKAHVLSLPGETLVARTIGANIDPDRIRVVRDGLLATVTTRIGHALEAAYREGDSDAPFSPDFRQAGQRALRNAALHLLVRGQAPVGAQLASDQYRRATNMTDRFAALSAAVGSWTEDAPALLGDFRTLYTADPLVFDKWLALNAMAPDDEVMERLRALLADPGFPRNNPNRLRSLMGTFAAGNPTQFARPDGEGFRFVTGFVADVDPRNPQVAAGVLTAFRAWRSYEPTRRDAAESALKSLQESAQLSRNTADILTRMLAG